MMDNTWRGPVAALRGKVTLKVWKGKITPVQLSSEFSVHADKICYGFYFKQSIHINQI